MNSLLRLSLINPAFSVTFPTLLCLVLNFEKTVKEQIGNVQLI